MRAPRAPRVPRVRRVWGGRGVPGLRDVPVVLVLVVLVLVGARWPAALPAQEPVTFPAADGGTVFAWWYRTAGAPLGTILAFHQGGASAVAEYAPIVPALTGAGWDVLAVDLRSGGDRFGGRNRTAEARAAAGIPEPGYCQVLPDLRGALAFGREEARARPLVLWGSSYSATLALRLAAEPAVAPDGRVVGVLAFSPAGGEPMAACRAEDVSERIPMPVLVLRPASEAEIPSVAVQIETFRAQGHRVVVAEPGAHGSSMLVGERVGAPVEGTWEEVMRFLDRLSPARPREHIDRAPAARPPRPASPDISVIRP